MPPGPWGVVKPLLPANAGPSSAPPAAERQAAANAVIHVLAEQATLDGTSDKPGYLPGFGILPAESVREVAKSAKLQAGGGARRGDTGSGVSPHRGDGGLPAVAGSDCRWPGCDRPIERCDIDHTVPYPFGPTHPSNNKPYCRTHHLIKTFCTGPGGWTEQQMPDGTIILTAPTAHTYATEAHGAAMFPALAQSTGELTGLMAVGEESPNRTAMMPKRKQTREQDKRDRINARTTPTNRTHRRRRTTTPSLARRQLPTTTLLSLTISAPQRVLFSPRCWFGALE